MKLWSFQPNWAAILCLSSRLHTEHRFPPTDYSVHNEYATHLLTERSVTKVFAVEQSRCSVRPARRTCSASTRTNTPSAASTWDPTKSACVATSTRWSTFRDSTSQGFASLVSHYKYNNSETNLCQSIYVPKNSTKLNWTRSVSDLFL